LCLVSRQFLHVAKELLYRKLNIVIVSPELESVVVGTEEEGNAKLISHLSTSPSCANLVKRLQVYFDEIPPPADCGTALAKLLGRLRKLQELRFLDQGKSFWRSANQLSRSQDDTIWRIITTLTETQKDTLRVLDIPQLSLQVGDTHALFTSLSSLETYKGTVVTRPNGLTLPHKVVSPLRRLFVTAFTQACDISFVLSASTHSLRYLHLTFRTENSFVNLGHLKNLETLVLAPQLVCAPMVGERGMDGATMMKKWSEIPNKLISTVLSTAESARSIETLRHFALVTNVDQFLPAHFERFFLRLPSSIVELSLSSYHCHTLPWSIFLANHRRLYPSLRKFYLRRPKDSKLNDMADSRAYFGMDDFEAETGINIEWIPTGDEAWKLWSAKQFDGTGTASDEELVGKENEHAKILTEAEQIGCAVA
jgi:hypothetical protein